MRRIELPAARLERPGLEAVAVDLAQVVRPAQARESLERAVERLTASEAIGLVVLDRPEGRVVGRLTHRDVLAAYSRRVGSEEGRQRGGIPA